MKKFLKIISYLLIVGSIIYGLGVLGYSDRFLPGFEYTFKRVLVVFISSLVGLLLYSISEVLK